MYVQLAQCQKRETATVCSWVQNWLPNDREVRSQCHMQPFYAVCHEPSAVGQGYTTYANRHLSCKDCVCELHFHGPPTACN